MTQKIARWWSGTLLGAALLGVSSSALATVVWTADFEEGNLDEWMPGINNEGNVEVLAEQIYAGAYAGKITVHPEDTFTFNQNRVDIQHQSTLTAEGADSWVSGYYYLVEDAKVRNEIGFYESNESFQNVMDFWVEPKQGGGTSLVFGVGFLGDNVLWTGDFTPGMWHQIALHVHWSTNEQMGSVDLWLDGMQVVTNEMAKTKADGNTLFFQTGLHRKDVAQFTEVLYIDNFIEADSMADAQIMAPMPGGGGASGAGGMAGGGGAAGAAMAGAAGMGGVAAGGMAGMATGGVAGSPAGGTVGTIGGASGAGGVTMSSAGMAYGLPTNPTTGGTAPVTTPAADTSSNGSGCAQARTGAASIHSLLFALFAAAGLLRFRRKSR